MSTISSSTTSTTAYKVTADTTGTLVIQTGATPTTAVTVDASQNVGIGTSSPSFTAGSGVMVQNATQANYRLADGTNYVDLLQNGGAGYLWNRATNFLSFGTSNTERMRIDSSGNVGIGTSSPTGYGTVNLNLNSSGDTMIHLTNTTSGTASSDGFDILLTGLNAQLINREAGYVSVYTSNTERMRIDSSGNLQFNSGYGSVATAYGCRAWVNFNGTGVVAIRASGNVTSITDNGVGLYTVNLTNAMPDTNYAVCGGVSAATPAANTNAPCFAVVANSTSAFSVSTFQSQSVGTQTDLAYDQFAVFR